MFPSNTYVHVNVPEALPDKQALKASARDEIQGEAAE